MPAVPCMFRIFASGGRGILCPVDAKIRRRLYTEYTVFARDLQKDPALLDEYPHRHVYVASLPKGFTGDVLGAALPALFWAVETLEDRGWETAAWFDGGNGFPGVVMRRKPSP